MFRRIFFEKPNYNALSRINSLLNKEQRINKILYINKNHEHNQVNQALDIEVAPASQQQQQKQKIELPKKVNIKDLFGVADNRDTFINIDANKTDIEIVDKALNSFNLENLDNKTAIETVKSILTAKGTIDLTRNEKAGSLFNYLIKNIKSFNDVDYVLINKLTIRFFKSEFNQIKNEFNIRIETLDPDQLSVLLIEFRVHKILRIDEFEELKQYLSTRISDLKTYDGLSCALSLFYANKEYINKINNNLLTISDKLTIDNWLNLISIKSINRQRDKPILESCAYHLLNSKEEFKVSDIKKCFLSFGILNFHDDQLYIRLLNDFSSKLDKLKEKLLNEENFNAILLSFGMLKLRDDAVLDKICSYLIKNIKEHSKILIINYIISCANINYKPKKLDELIVDIDLSLFDFEQERKRIQFLNFTWALCFLKKPNIKFIEHALNENFYKILIDEKKKEFMPSLFKLLQINLYCLTSIENYKGPTLPAEINVMEYQNHVTIRQQNLISDTLGNYLPKDKLFKSSLLLPYGIFIDSFLIMSKQGEIKPLEEFFNQETSEFDVDAEKYYKVAIKYLDYKDLTLISKKVNGNIRMQLNILNSLGYITIPVTHEELSKAGNAFKKVKLLQDKLKLYAKQPNFVEKYL